MKKLVGLGLVGAGAYWLSKGSAKDTDDDTIKKEEFEKVTPEEGKSASLYFDDYGDIILGKTTGERLYIRLKEDVSVIPDVASRKVVSDEGAFAFSGFLRPSSEYLMRVPKTGSVLVFSAKPARVTFYGYCTCYYREYKYIQCSDKWGYHWLWGYKGKCSSGYPCGVVTNINKTGLGIPYVASSVDISEPQENIVELSCEDKNRALVELQYLEARKENKGVILSYSLSIGAEVYMEGLPGEVTVDAYSSRLGSHCYTDTAGHRVLAPLLYIKTKDRTQVAVAKQRSPITQIQDIG